MISLAEAWQRIDALTVGQPILLPVEPCPARQAAGRILAVDLCAALSLPPFDKSAVDGYALPDGPDEAAYRIRETVAAGQVSARPLSKGTAVKVMTGAPVPPGTGRVVKVEHTAQTEDLVRVLRSEGSVNICRCGEDVRQGEPLLPAGTRLGPLEIANLIACGVTAVPVRRTLRVAVLTTGDELVDGPESLSAGKIIDTNGPLLEQLLQRHGLHLAARAVIRDDLDSTVSGLRSALEQADVTIVCGGVSVGDFDFVPAAMDRLGLTLHFAGLAVKPGKPSLLASRGSGPTLALAFGLPGNPVVVFLMYHLLVLRAIARLRGQSSPYREVRLPLGQRFARRKADRLEFVPCRLEPDGTVTPLPTNGPAHLRALLGSDAFFMVPPEVTTLEPPAAVPCLFFEPSRLGGPW